MQVSGARLGDAWSTMAAVASAVDARLGAWLADVHNVGLTEYRALDAVSRTSEKELRVNDLADSVGLNQSSATRLLSRLEAKGYARRDLCQDDARGVYAVITERGEDLVREVREPYRARIRELLADVGGDAADAVAVVEQAMRGE